MSCFQQITAVSSIKIYVVRNNEFKYEVCWIAGKWQVTALTFHPKEPRQVWTDPTVCRPLSQRLSCTGAFIT